MRSVAVKVVALVCFCVTVQAEFVEKFEDEEIPEVVTPVAFMDTRFLTSSPQNLLLNEIWENIRLGRRGDGPSSEHLQTFSTHKILNSADDRTSQNVRRTVSSEDREVDEIGEVVEPVRSSISLDIGRARGGAGARGTDYMISSQSPDPNDLLEWQKFVNDFKRKLRREELLEKTQRKIERTARVL